MCFSLSLQPWNTECAKSGALEGGLIFVAFSLEMKYFSRLVVVVELKCTRFHLALVFHDLSFQSREWCQTMTNLQNFLDHSDQADFLHRGLQGLRWKLDAWALWKKSIPVAQDLLLCSDWSRASFAERNICILILCVTVVIYKKYLKDQHRHAMSCGGQNRRHQLHHRKLEITRAATKLRKSFSGVLKTKTPKTPKTKNFLTLFGDHIFHLVTMKIFQSPVGACLIKVILDPA